MPVSVGKLCSDTARVAIEVDGETLNVLYRPSGLTPAVQETLRELVQEQRAGMSLVTVLRGTLVEWDLLDEEGKPLPTDEATLQELPIVFLAQVAEAISEDMRPKEKNG